MGSKSATALSLSFVLGRLAPIHAVPAPRASAFALIVHENIGYLIDDLRREQLFQEFESRIGLDAEKIIRAPDSLLMDIARRGGMRPDTRLERWRRIAEIVLTDCGGNLDAHLRSLPISHARKLLKKFPAIGDPGADRILLFSGLDARPALESNGLRVLVRLGLVGAANAYAASHRAAIGYLAHASAPDRRQYVSAYMLLREHGRAVCKRTGPHCMACPLDTICEHAPAKGL
ncbi:MAG TPA: hypothetical protein VHU23_09255 [Rhizomicrobium sp.]|jgi:endonuclease-3|nr:hypothetical protein [Rhizomicrobium sp.]